MSHTFKDSSLSAPDEIFEVPLRPQSLESFIGQDLVRERLDVMVRAARQRGEPLGHCLFSGPPGLGKTTLANILAKAMGSNIVVTSGPIIDKPGDLAGVLTNLQEGDILFIDELHRLSRNVEEYLYPAMEDFVLDLMIDSGPSARTVQVNLNKFTLVGATTRTGLISSPMRSRFSFTARLEHYTAEALQVIVLRTAGILRLSMSGEAAAEVAARARGTPRIANNLLRWIRDYAQIHSEGVVSRELVEKAMEMLSIDECGLEETDLKILRVMQDHYEGGPVGVNTIAIAVGEEPLTIEEVYEPYLIKLGFIKRTPRGRELTTLAREHLKKSKLQEFVL